MSRPGRRLFGKEYRAELADHRHLFVASIPMFVAAAILAVITVIGFVQPYIALGWFLLLLVASTPPVVTNQAVAKRTDLGISIGHCQRVLVIALVCYLASCLIAVLICAALGQLWQSIYWVLILSLGATPALVDAFRRLRNGPA